MPKVFTIGHSNQKAADFVALLLKHNIALVVDVRSIPYSRFRHFNGDRLKDRLVDLGIDYLYLGDRLGGHPPQDSSYLDDRVIYERLAMSPKFRSGIKRVVKESEQHSVVLMCTEQHPEDCHRHPLLALALQERGVQVLHIRRDGSVQDATELAEETDPQLPLFELVGEDLTWRSPKRIRRHEHSRNQMSAFPDPSIRLSYSATPTEMGIWLQSRLVNGWHEEKQM